MRDPQDTVCGWSQRSCTASVSTASSPCALMWTPEKCSSCLTSFFRFSLWTDSFSTEFKYTQMSQYQRGKRTLNSTILFFFPTILFNQNSVLFSLSKSNFPSHEVITTVDKILCLNLDIKSAVWPWFCYFTSLWFRNFVSKVELMIIFLLKDLCKD